MQNGSRNQSLYDFGRRLKSTGVPMEQVEKSMLLIYQYFCIDKDASYTINDVKASIASIGKLESTTRKSSWYNQNQATMTLIKYRDLLYLSHIELSMIHFIE